MAISITHVLLVISLVVIYVLYNKTLIPCPECPECPECPPIPVPLPTINKISPPAGCTQMLGRPYQPGDDPIGHAFCSGGVGLRLS